MAEAHLPDPRGAAALPQPLTSFVDRECQTEALRGLLACERLVVLTGPPGTGKTRLAMQVASGAGALFRDGVCLVELAALQDAALVPVAIARALGVQEMDQRPLEQLLIDALRARRLLVILDNLEHLLDAAGLIARLLEACPELTVLATSRERLRVRGEHVLVVPPLALPELGGAVSLELLRQYGATRLFLERSAALAPDAVTAESSAPVIAEICAELDGLPLAIELIVPQLRFFSLAELRARLLHPLAVDHERPRDLPPRQHSLQAAMNWSYRLLSPAERRLLRRLAVFAGGCTREAALAVCAAADLSPGDLEAALASLVDKSLVQAHEDPGGGHRFTMLRTVREFAAELLATDADALSIEHAHSAYFVALAEAGATQLAGGDQRAWLERLDRERHNLRLALNRLSVQDDAEAAQRLACALWYFWELHGDWSEAQAQFDRLLALPIPSHASVNRALRARMLLAAGVMRRLHADYAAAAEHLTQSLALFRATDDRPGMAEALNILADVTRLQGQPDRARVFALEGLALRRQLGDRLGCAWSLAVLGSLDMGSMDCAAARGHLSESVAIFRAVGERAALAWALNTLASIACDEGELAEADRLLDESIAAAGELGVHTQTVGWTECSLGWVRLAQSRPGEAAERFQQALEAGKYRGDRRLILAGIEGIVALDVGQGNDVRAVRLAGFASSLHAAMSAPDKESERQQYRRALAELRRSLDDEEFAGAWSAGSALLIDAAVEEALAIVMPPHTADRPPLAANGRHADPATERLPLTPREVEVLTLLARGCMAREIATSLVISRATVQRHIANIYGKVGLRGRVDATAYAFRHGFVSPAETGSSPPR